MSNKDLYFKGQDQKEDYICFFRQHWTSIIKEIFTIVLLFAIIVISFINMRAVIDLIKDEGSLQLLFILIFTSSIILLHKTFYKTLNYFLKIGIITNLRVIDHSKDIFFKDIKESVRMGQIQNVERSNDGFFANLLNFGDIKIYLNASSAIKNLKKIPNPKFHFRCINRQIEITRGKTKYQSKEN